MASIVELKYNPFIPRLNILIDGLHPSDFSQLIQYADEDIFNWVFCICESIYSEIRDDYVIVFTGTDSDATLLRVAAKKDPHCKSFRHIGFAIDTPVNQRMIALQKYIATNNICQYKINRIGFRLFSEDNAEIDELLIKRKMNISNRFCIVSEANQKCSAVYDFIFAASLHSGLSMLSDKKDNFSFIIIIGQNDELLDIDSNYVCYSAKKESIIQTVFSCLLSFPLVTALRNTYNSLAKENMPIELQLCVAVEPVVKTRIAGVLELGGTTNLITDFYPDNLQAPKLLYKIQNTTIAACNGIYVSGKSVGQTKLEIYKVGETIPVDVIDIAVIKRNRIKSLFLSQEQLILGLGDSITLCVDYSPADADNKDTIKWKSSDENVIRLHNGRVKAIGIGCCRIICTAENVSAQCLCTVKEYLRDIIIQPEFENDRIELCPMEETELFLTKVPEDSIDGDLYIYSSDNDIVNHVGSKLIGKAPGNATVQIYNSSKTVIKTLEVSVVSSKKRSNIIRKIKKFIGLEE